MSITKRSENKSTYEASLEGGVKICAALDMRYKGLEKIPIVIRVTFQRERFFYATGVKVTIGEYEDIVRSNGTKGEVARTKRDVQQIFNKVKSKAEELLKEGEFSLSELKSALKPKVKDVVEMPSLYQLWQEFAGTKSLKTGDQYRQACISFFKSMGCSTSRIDLPDGKKSRRMELHGKSLKMKPQEITSSIIDGWVKKMAADGNSDATIAMNLRAFKALLNSMLENGVLNKLPKFKIKSGGKRDEDVLPVRDILKIMNYDGEYKDMASWWLIVYLSNGANVRDLAELKYTDSYQYDHTLNFIRHKTHSKSPSKVVVPVIPELQTLLDKYAAPYKPGELVFPDIFGTAVSESQKLSRVHDFCAKVREGMAEVCKSLNIRPATVVISNFASPESEK